MSRASVRATGSAPSSCSARTCVATWTASRWRTWSTNGRVTKVITLGVIVAGGQGRRLGLAVPKAMAPLLGITLLERAIATLAPACDAIAVAAPEDRPLALPEVRIECFRVADPAGASGPLAGVVAGLESRRYDRAMVLGVDFPLLRPAVVHALLERLGDRRAVFPAPGGVPQPLAAVYGAG